MYPQTSPRRPQVSPPPSVLLIPLIAPSSYLHINGFIHRDIKAANLLVDDDGTVLVGDLGVAAPLVDDDEQTVMHPISPASSNLKFDLPPRPKYSDDGIPHSRPQFGKRKSFVGTVRPYLHASGTSTHPPLIAMLDGAGAHTGKTLRRQGRYLVIWNYRHRTHARPPTTIA